MNSSDVQDDFEISCQIFGKTYFLITKLPSKHLLINHVSGIVVSSILIIPTVLLNAIAIKTILRSSQLYSKPCYFIILLQSVIDLAVGVLGIPLFILYLASGIGGFSNCYVSTLALQLTFLQVSVSEVTINVITLQRYLAILHPHFHRTKVTKKRLLIVEAFGCVGVIILILFFRTTKNTAGAVGVTLVFLFNAFAYTKIYLVVRKAARSRKQLQDLASDQKFTRLILFFHNIKQAKSSFMVVICFFILVFLPTAIAGPFYASADKFEQLVIIIWINVLLQSNSSVNSVIFFWARPLLKTDALKILKNMNQC